ncbi:MAG: hypothetical protein E7619_07970 [Ruminococcaceae bacterium]|nr:hypothetical protein [Oscillospiraceae bacterium]
MRRTVFVSAEKIAADEARRSKQSAAVFSYGKLLARMKRSMRRTVFVSAEKIAADEARRSK